MASESSSQANFTPRVYKWSQFATQQKYKLKGRCVECNTALKSQRNPASLNNVIHLCMNCSTLAYAIFLEDKAVYTVDQLLDPDFLERELAVNYDVWAGLNNHRRSEFGHTKVYTCFKCTGPKTHNNPFKFCFDCILTDSPICADKELAAKVLEKLPPLLSHPIIGQYLLKRKQLHKSRKQLVSDVATYHCSEWSQPDIPETETCPIAPVDITAGKHVEKQRIDVISNSSDQLIPDISSMISSFEGLAFGCDQDGKIVRKVKTIKDNDELLHTQRDFVIAKLDS
jgi:hypothetical protein